LGCQKEEPLKIVFFQIRIQVKVVMGSSGPNDPDPVTGMRWVMRNSKIVSGCAKKELSMRLPWVGQFSIANQYATKFLNSNGAENFFHLSGFERFHHAS
jgi:hypothetical protein